MTADEAKLALLKSMLEAEAQRVDELERLLTQSLFAEASMRTALESIWKFVVQAAEKPEANKLLSALWHVAFKCVDTLEANPSPQRKAHNDE